MHRKLIIGAIGLIVIALALWQFVFADRNEKDKLQTQATGLDSEIERSLRIANPTEAELKREMDLLAEAALKAGEIPLPETRSLPDIESIIAQSSEPAATPNYDLAALKKQLLDTLQLTNAEARRAGLREIASFLASKDAETASQFMKAILSTGDHFTDSDAVAFATEFVDALSRNDPVAAAAWTESLPERLKYPTHQLLARNWAAQDLTSADMWAKTMPDAGLRANAIRMMSSALTSPDMQDAASAWVQSLAQRPEDGPRLSDVVVKHWSKVDFDGAYAWTNTLQNPDDREQAVVALTKARAETDPSVAANWASTTLEGNIRARAIQEAVVMWLGKDPAAAAGWVDKLQEPAVFDAAFDMIAMAWMKKDQAKATSWVAAAPVAAHRKEYVQMATRQ